MTDLTPSGVESVDLEHQARAFSEALGRTIRYRDIPVAAWADALRKAGVPEHLLKHLLVMAELHQQGRYDRMTDDLERPTGRPATRARDFVTLHAGEFTRAVAAWRGNDDPPCCCCDPAAASLAVGPAALRGAKADNLIRPFQVHVPQAALDDLHLRLSLTRWPDKELVDDQSQGIQLAKLQPLVAYWSTQYDWRKAEARLNALPQFMTEIDGVEIHFIHVRSKHPNALPVIITHGWPGSVFEMVKSIGPLTDPTAHGGHAEDAFDVVIPSMPGFGFSGKPTETGWGPDRIARAWAELMKRLGYTRYVAQGGDWGSPVSQAMARLVPAGLIGIHVNLPAAVPPEIASVLASGGPAPADLTKEEKTAFDALSAGAKMGSRSYAAMMGTKPQTIGYAVTDSPVGLAAWMLGHPGFSHWTYDSSDPEKSPDEVLDDITLYWLTNTATSAGRIYWEYGGGKSVVFSAVEKTTEIALPVAVTVFPKEIYQAPESWARRAYPTLSYFHVAEKGGHFAAWEQPEIYTRELRAAFRTLRKEN